jgi:TonB family protein
VTSAAVNSLLATPPQPLGRYLVPSVLVHAVVLGLILGYGALTARPMLDLDQKPIRATLVRQGTPRDEKLLPRIEELPPPPAPPPAPVAAPATAIPEPPKAKPPVVKPDERQKLLGAFDQFSKSKRKPETAGAVDGDPSGDGAKAEGDRYLGQLGVQIKRFYDVSSTIPDQERIRLRAEVALFIEPNGQLLRVRLAKSSGNDLFDAAVLAAVKKAAPFAPPPTQWRTTLQKYGMVLSFVP